jgi:hypothetical protein
MMMIYDDDSGGHYNNRMDGCMYVWLYLGMYVCMMMIDYNVDDDRWYDNDDDRW